MNEDLPYGRCIDFPLMDYVLFGVAILLAVGLLACFVLLARELSKREHHE